MYEALGWKDLKLPACLLLGFWKDEAAALIDQHIFSALGTKQREKFNKSNEARLLSHLWGSGAALVSSYVCCVPALIKTEIFLPFCLQNVLLLTRLHGQQQPIKGWIDDGPSKLESRALDKWGSLPRYNYQGFLSEHPDCSLNCSSGQAVAPFWPDLWAMLGYTVCSRRKSINGSKLVHGIWS